VGAPIKEDTKPLKICVHCSEEKPFDDFHKNARNKKDGRQSSCKPCNNDRVRKWQSENPDKFESNWKKQAQAPDYHHRRRARKYGLTVQQLDELLEDAGGVCMICSQPAHMYLVVDHCHTSGVVRGILCEKCNQGLGMFKDNPEYLQNAITYLAQFSKD